MIPINQAGVPSYDELVLVVREDEARTRGQDLRAFMQALTAGRAPGARQPGRRRRAAGQGQPLAGSKAPAGIDRAHAARGAAGRQSDPFGWQEPSAWASFGSWMLAHGLLRHNPNAGQQPFTNEFLPGQGI